MVVVVFVPGPVVVPGAKAATGMAIAVIIATPIVGLIAIPVCSAAAVVVARQRGIRGQDKQGSRGKQCQRCFH